jgi:hypothetical protein
MVRHEKSANFPVLQALTALPAMWQDIRSCDRPASKNSRMARPQRKNGRLSGMHLHDSMSFKVYTVTISMN